MKKTIHLLIFAKHIDGGTGTFVLQLTKLVSSSKGKIKISILALEKPQFRTIKMKGVTIRYFSTKSMLPYYYVLNPKALIHIFKELLWLKIEVKKTNPDVILAVDNHCNVLVCFLKLLMPKLTNVKLILTIHNNISAVTFSKLSLVSRAMFKVTCRFLFRQATKIVAVSNGVANDVQSFFELKNKPDVIYYGVNYSNIQKLAREPLEPKDGRIFKSKRLKVLSIGRFAQQKNFTTLIEAFADQRLKHINARLFLIGDGPDKTKLVTTVKKFDLENRVHFLGWKQNVYPYIKAADVFVLSSHYEGFPFVLLEALALKRPVVSTDSPYGPSELLENGKYGTLIPVGDSQSLANLLSNLFSNLLLYKHWEHLSKLRGEKFSEKLMLSKYFHLIWKI